MKIVKPGFEIINMPAEQEVYKLIEAAGRTCYRSEHKIHADSAPKFVGNIIKAGHLSVVEHCSVSVKIICDRAISHELVRHRLCSFSQSSTRYCNFSKDKFGNEITVIKPCFWNEGSELYELWKQSCLADESVYMDLIEKGAKPERARSVLPNSLKTELIMTANIRAWRELLQIRTTKAVHPQMREITIPLLEEFKEKLPVLFGDINETQID